MKYWTSGIAVSLIAFTGIVIKALASSDVGLHVELSAIQNTFTRHLVKYVGDCPGEEWSGLAANGDIRFISNNTKPNAKLKVSLVNLKTGQNIDRNYKKLGQGSNDFNFSQLGDSDGTHEIQYQIYDQDSKQILEEGSFSYTITSSSETQKRNGNWKLELSCSSDSIRKCENVQTREVAYCGGVTHVRHTGNININQSTAKIDLYH